VDLVVDLDVGCPVEGEGLAVGVGGDPPIRRANSAAYEWDSGDISITEPGVGRSAL
jgi:hypothetical protein